MANAGQARFHRPATFLEGTTMHAPRQGLQFRLRDLFVLVFVVGGILALFVPAIQAAREAARRMMCQNRLKQIGLGIQNYYDVFAEKLPANYGPATSEIDDGNSWMVSLLPFIEQMNIAQRILDRRANGEGASLESVMSETWKFAPPARSRDSREPPPLRQLPNAAIPQIVIGTFLCPSAVSGDRALMGGRQGWQGDVAGINRDTKLAVTCYKGVSGSNWGQELHGGRVHDMPGNCIGRVGPSRDEARQRTFQVAWPTWILKDETDVSYVGHDYGDGIFPRNGSGRTVEYLSLDDCTDGFSRTFAVGEVVPTWCDWSWWYGWNGATGTCALPINHRLYDNRAQAGFHDVLAESGGFHSVHPGGAQFAMLDGSVQFVVNHVNHSIYRELASHAGGEISGIID
jgi:prepilin-type processing-associated H-X9-DG protein